jgi:hypothetical protein
VRVSHLEGFQANLIARLYWCCDRKPKKSAFLREKVVASQQEFITKPGRLSTIRIVDFKNGGRLAVVVTQKFVT